MTAPAKLSRATDYAGSEALGPALASKGRVPGEPMSVTVENLVKEFGVTPALHGVSLEIKGGELLALLALVTLAVKTALEWRFGDELASNRK